MAHVRRRALALCKSQGFCIRRLDYSETSQVVTFYTRDEGRVDLIAKGAKRKRSAVGGRIDLFACGEVVFVRRQRGGLHVLAEFSASERFDGLRRSLQRAYSAFYVAELVDRGLYEGEANRSFYEFCVATLGQLAGGESVDVTRMIFEAHWLDVMGVAPQTRQCVECGGPLPRRGQVAFGVGRGGALCPRCAPPDAQQVPAAVLGVVEGLRRASPQSADRIAIARRDVAFVRRVLRGCVVHALERQPRMLELV